ncbi:crotonase/enoyl-CoA hydratase family protein [Aureimonas populi]|uniref:Crotonase/enoyl-CoA hydratase family protein n=1 Tax=Aureimonas populi TaxID=1701758 RepID=A0ABW5CML9_9HYPH|nr:crotonase/enoyl-CoA hydratase family protein [Aureimonas populi]
MSDFITTAQDAGVLTVGLNRPDKKNAIDRAMYRAMADALQRASADPAVRAVLVKGVPGAFSSGNDITDFLAIATGGEKTDEVEAFLFALADCRKPLIAAVDGLAIGIGTTMLMHFDLVHASPSSIFRTPFLDLGLVPEAASSLLAPRLMGHQRAFALLVAGEGFDAEAARAANLVTAIVPGGEVEEVALRAAHALAGKPPEALAIARDLLRGDRAEILDRIRLEADHFHKRLRSEEARAAFMAFMARGKRS